MVIVSNACLHDFNSPSGSISGGLEAAGDVTTKEGGGSKVDEDGPVMQVWNNPLLNL